MRAWTLCCFHGLITIVITILLEDAESVVGQLRGAKECPISGVTDSGRVWRKVPESDAGSVGSATQSYLVSKFISYRHLVDFARG